MNNIHQQSSFEDRYLGFALGDEHFVVPLLRVKEVIGVQEFTRLPFAPVYFCGMINLRGHVISIIDLRKKFNIQPKTHNENAVIICDLDDITMGIMVDSVDYVINIPKDQILSKPHVQSSINTEYISGIFNHKSALLIILNLEKTLNVQDITIIQNQNKKIA